MHVPLAKNFPSFAVGEIWLWERSPVFFLLAASNKSFLLLICGLAVCFLACYQSTGKPIFFGNIPPNSWSRFKPLICSAMFSHSVVSDSVTPWTVAARLCSWGCSRQEYWSGLPCPRHRCERTILHNKSFISTFQLFIYLFLVALALHCCTQAFPSGSEQGFSRRFLALGSTGLVGAQASVVMARTWALEHRLSSHGAQA